jgi:RNA polymerase sigma-70 factor (ECF subfamily)
MDSAELDKLVRELVEAGRNDHPTLNVPPEVLARRLAPLLVDEVPKLHASDLFLCCACLENLPGAVAILDNKFLSQVERFLAGMKQPAAFADEVRQMMREKLFVAPAGATPKIAEYSGRGTLGNWLRVVATRTAYDLLRQRNQLPAEAQTGGRDADPAAPDIELDYIKERYRPAFKQALRDSVAMLSPEQQNLLRMHYLEGVTLDQLAAFFHVNRTTIVRRMVAAREAILEQVRELACERLAIETAECDSLIDLVRSSLDLSLPTLLPNATR